MHFSADPLELIRILGALSDPDAEEAGDITLTAKETRITAEKGLMQTGTIAMIFEPGQSVISNNQLNQILRALKRQYGKRKKPDNITVEITEHHLKFGSFVIKVRPVEADVPVKYWTKTSPAPKPSDWLDRRWWEEPSQITSYKHGVQHPPKPPKREKFTGLYFVAIAILLVVAACVPGKTTVQALCMIGVVVLLWGGLLYRAGRG